MLGRRSALLSPPEYGRCLSRADGLAAAIGHVDQLSKGGPWEVRPPLYEAANVMLTRAPWASAASRVGA